MDQTVFMAVIAAAALHAVMNCALKRAPDPLAAAIFLAIGGGAVATPVLLLAGTPPLAAAPYLAASIVIHIFYWTLLGKAYGAGEVGTVFPLARGMAPILVMIVGTLLLGDHLSTPELVAAAAIIAGILVVAASGTRLGRGEAKAVLLRAFLVACCTMGYTIVDGLGARAGGDAIAYVSFLYLANGWALLAYGLVFHRARLAAAIDWGLWVGPLSGALSLAIYGAGVWAMTRAPIPLVAALRESSVLFAVILASLWLKEPFRFARLLGAAIIAGGLAGAKMM
jgi:drug/metabolite transporter (DMT)-like permease